MPESTFKHSLFGEVRFTTRRDEWVRGDKISFLSGFDISSIRPLIIPQLIGIKGTSNGKLDVHERCHAQLAMAFREIERHGLLHHITSCAGVLNFRLRRPTNGKLSKLPSNHAFGIAIDLNADDKQLGATVAPVAPVFEALGFKWGKAFGDPMHFEVLRFIEHPEPVELAAELELATVG